MLSEDGVRSWAALLFLLVLEQLWGRGHTNRVTVICQQENQTWSSMSILGHGLFPLCSSWISGHRESCLASQARKMEIKSYFQPTFRGSQSQVCETAGERYSGHPLVLKCIQPCSQQSILGYVLWRIFTPCPQRKMYKKSHFNIIEDSRNQKS